MSASRVLASREWSPPEGALAVDAPLALLVHGIAGWSRTWWRVAPALADRGWRVVGLDLRGHGGSPPIDGVFSATSLAADVEVTMEQMGIAAADVVVAHSLGAAVTMELVHRRPDIARRVVLEEPPGQTRADDIAFQEVLEREVLAARNDPEAEMRRELVENPAWLPEDARQDVEGRAMSDLDGILASLRADTGVRAPDLAPIIGVPALYLLADETRSALGATRARLIRELPPTAELVEFDSGHTIHRDRFDAYLAEVLRWLGGH
jgi:pimeloyl-ACP methyl ester carboxylesterase